MVRRKHQGTAIWTLFLLYLIATAWIIIWKLEIPYIGAGTRRTIKVIPFLADGTHNASPVLEIAVNILLFIPLGGYLALLLPRWRWIHSVLAAAGASLILEFTQFVLSVGMSDITDLITNTLGGVLGFGMWSLLRLRFGLRGPVISRRILVAFTLVFLCLVVAFVASPWQFSPPRDVAGF